MPTFLSLSPQAKRQLSQSHLDQLAPLLLDPEQHNPALRWAISKELSKVAIQVQRSSFALSYEHSLALLQAGVRWAELRRVDQDSGRSRPMEWPQLRRIAKTAAAMELDSTQKAELAEWTVRLALARLRRPPPPITSHPLRYTSSDPDSDEAGATASELVSDTPPSSSAADFSVRTYRLALSLNPACASATPSPHGSIILVALLGSHPQLAAQHLSNMLDYNCILTGPALARFLLSPGREEPEADPYAHARQVLDAACASGGARTARELDALLEERLARVDKEEAARVQPMLAFLRWMVEDWPGVATASGEGIDKEEGLRLALQTWEVVYGQGGEHQTSRRPNLDALEKLVKDVCSLQEAAFESTGASAPLPPTRLAIRLASTHLLPPMLCNLSHRLLNAALVHSRDPHLGQDLYQALRARCSGSSRKPFLWHANLRQTFAQLVLDAERAHDPAAVLQLYYDWTGDGLVLPVGLWTQVWRAAGQRSQVEEVGRLVADHETAGRGKVPAEVVAIVIKASAAERRTVKTLRLLNYFRSRARTVGSLGGGRSVVPLETYEAVLELLSTSATDRRAAGMAVFAGLMEEGHRPTTSTWNHLIAAQVFRPRFHTEDIDNAGVALNSLVAAGASPDARSFSLMMHGFLRLARSGKAKSGVAAIAAHRAFSRALSRGLAVRGEQVAALMRELARRGRWEDAKEVSEQWWRLLSARTEGEGRVTGMDEVRLAGDEVERIERRAVAQGVQGEDEAGAAEGGEAVDEVPEAVEEWEGEDRVEQRSKEAFTVADGGEVER